MFPPPFAKPERQRRPSHDDAYSVSGSGDAGGTPGNGGPLGWGGRGYETVQFLFGATRWCFGEHARISPSRCRTRSPCQPRAALSQHDAACRSAFETAVFQVTDMKSTVSCSSFRRGRVSTFLSGVSPDLCDS
jgi:hypothetical protein